MLSLISFCPGKPAMEEAAMCVRVLFLLTLLFFARAAPAQRTQTPQQAGPRQIDGTVRMDGRTAPPGVLVLLDYAEVRESRCDRRFFRRLLNRRHERLCHFGRHSGRRKEAEPDAEQVLTIAQLGQSWNLGIIREVG